MSAPRRSAALAVDSGMNAGFMIAKIRGLLQRLAIGEVPPVMRLLPYIRQALESARRQEEFPVLNLFCHWVVHASISNTHTGFQLLSKVDEEVSAILALPSGEGSLDPFIQGLGRSLLIPELRREMREYLTSLGIVMPALDSHRQWTALLHEIYSEILGKRVSYPSPEDLRRASLRGHDRHRKARALIQASMERWMARRGDAKRIVRAVALLNPAPEYSPEGVLVKPAPGFRWEIALEAPGLGEPEVGLILLVVPAANPESADRFRLP